MKKNWALIKSSKWYKIVSNKFLLTTLGFIVWMLFLDVNSFLIHSELDQEIIELEESIEYYRKEIKIDQEQLQELNSDPEKLEKFARERYWMKKQGEEIFLIAD